jgi:hypothetical protein
VPSNHSPVMGWWLMASFSEKTSMRPEGGKPAQTQAGDAGMGEELAEANHESSALAAVGRARYVAGGPRG